MHVDFQRVLEAALASPGVLAALEALVRRVVREELAGSPVGDSLVDVDQAADLLSMTPAAVRKAIQRGALPCVRMGRRVKFRRSELLALDRNPRRKAYP